MTFISQQCSFYLTYNNSQELLRYQALSGLGFNKLGFYQQCIEDPNNQFYLIEGVSTLFGQRADNAAHVFMSGICFNRKCNAADLQYAMGSLEQYVKLPFKLNKVETPSLIEVNYDLLTLIVLAVLSILFLLFLVSSVIDCLSKNNKIRKKNFKIIDIFSILTTLRLLQSRSERTNERVKTFSGIKTFCLIGIMITNLGIVAYNAPTTSIYSQTQDGSIFVTFYAVDIWLMTSGFFLSYLLLKQYSKLQDSKILLLKIVRRFLRLWPIYLLSLFLNWNVIPLVGNGPLWPLLIDYPKKFCSNVFTHIFMVSNFFERGCYNWLWLFQLDFQLCFLFVPILLFYIKGTQKWQKALFYTIQVIFITSCLGVTYMIDPQKRKDMTQYFFHEEYRGWNIMPLTRSGGYLIGYNIGILYYRFKKTQDKHSLWIIKKLEMKFYRIVLPMIGLLGLVGVAISFDIIGQKELEFSHYLYFTSLHTIIPVLMAFIMLPSLFGYYSPIKKLLQSWICNLISKLSISLYAIHYVVALYVVYCRQYDLELSNFTVIYVACCTIIPSLIISVVLTTTVEIPVFVIKKKYWKTESITYFEH